MSGGLLGVRAAETKDIKYVLTSAVTAPNAARACPAVSTIPASSQGLCSLAGVLPGCFILPRDDQSAGLQSD